jgi:hypothetical protein
VRSAGTPREEPAQRRAGLFAFAAASGFLGAGLYINVVEQPARLKLDARSMVREWVPSNRRGFFLVAMLALVSASERATLIQDQAPIRNVDSKIHSRRFDCRALLVVCRSSPTFCNKICQTDLRGGERCR